MKVEDIVKAGEMIERASGFYLTLILIGGILSILVLFVWLIDLGIAKSDMLFKRKFRSLAIILGVTVLFWGLIYYDDTIERPKYLAEVEHWEKEMVKPYINSLEKTVQPIDIIRLEPALEDNVMKGKQRLTLIYTKDGELVTNTSTFTVEVSEDTTIEPYLEYVRLNTDLGKGYDAGSYNRKVVIPKGYKYTE